VRSRAYHSRDDERHWSELPGFVWVGRLARLLMRRPKDSLVALVATAAVGAVIINGLFLQPGPHPAPIFPMQPAPVVSSDATGAVMLPKARPVEASPRNVEIAPAVPAAARPRSDTVSDIQRELTSRGFYDGAVDGVYGAKTDAAIRDFEQAAGRKASTDPNEALLQDLRRSNVKAAAAGAPAKPRRNDPIGEMIGPSRQVMAVQRALSDFGYGQIKPTGMFDKDTKTAIEKFERERKMPITGDISERLVRELAARTGRPLEQ
jgi:peptidoglycan hydrolase-like protein with peptidoglycan-binding domain